MSKKRMIELQGVSKKVTSGNHSLTILQPTDLSIVTGEFVSIIGPSGSGKSTLLGLIAGLDVPTSGHVFVDAVDVTGLDEDRLAKFRGENIGFVFQFFHLIPSLKAIENMFCRTTAFGKPGHLHKWYQRRQWKDQRRDAIPHLTSRIAGPKSWNPGQDRLNGEPNGQREHRLHRYGILGKEPSQELLQLARL